MAAPSWKNVPASAFRAGKPRIRKPVLAAHFSGSSSELDNSLSKEESSSQTQQGWSSSENASVDVSGNGKVWKHSAFGSTEEGTGESAQIPPRRAESNQHSLSFELQSISTAAPSKSSSQDDLRTPGSGLPTEAEVLLSPASSSHTNTLVTDITGNSIPSPCIDDMQSSDRVSKQAFVPQVGQTTQPAASSLEQQNKPLEMPYKFSGFPSTAFRISPLSRIFERLLPLQTFRHSPVSGSGLPNSEHHSPSTEAGEEVMGPCLDLDDETSLTQVCGEGVEETLMEVEEESHGRSATVEPLPGKTVVGECDISRSSFLAMDVEGLLMEACSSKSVSQGRVWAKYPKRNELSGGIDVERVVLEHRTEQKRKRSPSKRARGASWRDETKSGSRDVVRKKRLRGKKNAEEEEEEGEEGGGSVVGQREKRRSKKPKKPSPNAFIAVRIPSPRIRSGLEAVQKGMLEKEKMIRSTLTSLKKLHITLSVIRLEKGDEGRAELALLDATRKAVADLCLTERPLTLEFSGLASFGKRVVFAGLVEGESSERLRAIADIVRSVFDQHGLPDTDGRTFSPHLTIAKMSAYREHRRWGRPSRQRRLTGITEEHYGEFKDAEFGVQTVTGLELLSMTEPEDKEGYYHCFQRLSFHEVCVKALPLEQPMSGVSGSSELTKSSGVMDDCAREEEV